MVYQSVGFEAYHAAIRVMTAFFVSLIDERKVKFPYIQTDGKNQLGTSDSVDNGRENNTTFIPAREFPTLQAAKIAAKKMLDQELGEGVVSVHVELPGTVSNRCYSIERSLHTGYRYVRTNYDLQPLC